MWLKNIIWFIPLDLVKFGMNATVIRYLRKRRLGQIVTADAVDHPADGIPGVEATSVHQLIRRQSRAASIHGSLYGNRTSFLRRTMKKVGGFGGKVKVKEEELKKFGIASTKTAGQTLAGHSGRSHDAHGESSQS